MAVILSGRVATLRAPSAQRPIRKSGRCSGEFFTRKGSSRSQTPVVIPQSEFRVKFLHNSSVRMVWPTVYDGQEVTIITLFYFYPNVVTWVRLNNAFGTQFALFLLPLPVFTTIYRQYWIGFLVLRIFTILPICSKKQTANKQIWIVLCLCLSCLSK